MGLFWTENGAFEYVWHKQPIEVFVRFSTWIKTWINQLL